MADKPLAALSEESLKEMEKQTAKDESKTKKNKDIDSASDGTTVIDEPLDDAPSGRLTESGLAVAQSTLEVAKYYSTLMSKCPDEDFAVGSALWLLRDKCQVRIRQGDYAAHFLRVPPKQRRPEKYDEIFTQLGLIPDPMGTNNPHSWSAGPSDKEAKANIHAIALAFDSPGVASRFSGPPTGVPAADAPESSLVLGGGDGNASGNGNGDRGESHAIQPADGPLSQSIPQGQGSPGKIIGSMPLKRRGGRQTGSAIMRDFNKIQRDDEAIARAAKTLPAFHAGVNEAGEAYIRGAEKAIQFMQRTSAFSAESSNPCRFVYVPREVRSSDAYRHIYNDLGLKADPRNDSHKHLWTIDPTNSVQSPEGISSLWTVVRNAMMDSRLAELMEMIPALPTTIVNPLNRSKRGRGGRDPALTGPGAGHVEAGARVRKRSKKASNNASVDLDAYLDGEGDGAGAGSRRKRKFHVHHHRSGLSAEKEKERLRARVAAEAEAHAEREREMSVGGLDAVPFPSPALLAAQKKAQAITGDMDMRGVGTNTIGTRMSINASPMSMVGGSATATATPVGIAGVGLGSASTDKSLKKRAKKPRVGAGAGAGVEAGDGAEAGAAPMGDDYGVGLGLSAFDAHRRFLSSVESRVVHLEHRNAELLRRALDAEKEAAKYRAVNDELKVLLHSVNARR